MTDWKTATLGKTGWKVGRLGLASSYGADERCVQMAFERGVNYLYWGTMRTAKFGEGLRRLRSRRDEFRLVIQSYSRVAAMVPWSLERALKSLGMDHADILLLGLWNKDVSPAIFDQALRLIREYVPIDACKRKGIVQINHGLSNNRFCAFANEAGIRTKHQRNRASRIGTGEKSLNLRRPQRRHAEPP